MGKTTSEEIVAVRRQRLRTAIDERFGKSPAALARAAKKPDRQINDMLYGRKAFGDKIAREIEQNAELPRYYLDGLSPWPFEAIDYAKIERLLPEQLSQVEGAIRLMLAQFEERREPIADVGRRRDAYVIDEGVTGPDGVTSGDEAHGRPRPRKPGAQRK